jgi:hypothetical protein
LKIIDLTSKVTQMEQTLPNGFNFYKTVVVEDNQKTLLFALRQGTKVVSSIKCDLDDQHAEEKLDAYLNNYKKSNKWTR